MHNNVVKYYVNQAGNGLGHYYVGSSHQKGYGLGGFLGGLFRTILPFLKSGAAAVGREALRTGSHILADAASGGIPLSSSVQRHTEEAGGNLMRKLSAKLSGNGIKRRRTASKRQSGAKKAPVRTKRQKTGKCQERDIYH